MATNPMLLQQLYRNQAQGNGAPLNDPYASGQSYMPEVLPQVGQEANATQSYNPFDIGIARATQSARSALSMAPDQESRALRSALIAFGDSIGQQPIRRGFMANLGQGLKALGPSVMSYDQQEANALAENQAMAEKILAYRAAEEEKARALDQQAWSRDFAERQLAEGRRYHDLVGNRSAGAKGTHSGGAGGDLSKLFTHAEEVIAGGKERDKDGNIVITDKAREAERGRIARLANRILPGGEMRLTPEQKRLQTLGDTIRGRLFRKWGYRNETEFEHVPSINIDDSVEANLKAIEELKALDAMEGGSDFGVPSDFLEDSQGYILFADPVTGETQEIPAANREKALGRGLVEVQ